MKALITGGAGFIGSNLAKRLLEEGGWQVTIVDDLSGGSQSVAFVPHDVKLILGDMVNGIIPEIIDKAEYDVVFHLAAKPSVAYSVEHPSETTDINLLRTVKLMEVCQGKIGRFINTSSSAVYGNTEALPTPEWAPHDPQSPYGMQKSQAEQFAKLFHFLYEMDVVSIRPFNVFGPNQLGGGPYSCAISSWLHAVKHGKSIRIDGNGTQSRDLTYVDNVVDLFVKVAKHPHRFHAGEVFNAGSGKRWTNSFLLGWFQNEYPETMVVNAPARPRDVAHTLVDMSKAERVLGWKELVPFYDGLEKTRSWAMGSPLF